MSFDYLQWFVDWRKNNTTDTDSALLEKFHMGTTFFRSLTITTPSEPLNVKRIILNVMMKNEHLIMTRCIQSCLSIVDAICYSDTGSDATVFNILKEIIPPHTHLNIDIEPWKDFGYNRSMGLKQTERFAKFMGWDLNNTYVLLLDADMVLDIGASFNKEALSEPEYLVRQHNGQLVYWNQRLLQLSKLWKCVGRTHEFYRSELSSTPTLLYDLNILDLNDGNNRLEKHTRDIQLLELDMRDDPTNPRPYFYMGDAYRYRNRDGDLHKAIHYFEKHIDLQTQWDEERFTSMYYIGWCYKDLNNEPMMLKWLLRAHAFRPSRSEPLYLLGKYYSERENHTTAMIFFRLAIKMPQPNDIIFVEKDVYQYKIPYETSISAFYTNIPTDKALGQRAAQCLLLTEAVPFFNRDLTLYNMRFYLQSFPIMEKIALNPQQLPDYYNPCNPSLLIRKNQLLVLCRGVNYTQSKARNFKVRDPSTEFYHSVHVFLKFNLNNLHSPTHEVLLKSEHIQGPYHDACKVRGLEDGRIIDVNGNLGFSCTSMEFTENNQPAQCWAEFDEKTGDITSVVKMHGYDDNLVQKNWLPFVDQQKLCFIYGYSPLTVLELTTNGKLKKVRQTLPTQSLAVTDWRGSCGPVAFDDGHLFMIHEVCDRPDERRYMHRWVKTDQHWRITQISGLCYFLHHEGVEMVTGMACVDETRIILSIGIEDKEAWLVTVDMNQIRKSLMCPRDFENLLYN